MLTNISFKAIIRQHWIPCRNKRTYICKNYINDQRAHIFQLNQRVYFLNCNQMIIHLFLCYCRPCFLKPSAMKISSRMQFVCLYAFASNACKLEVKHIIYSIWMWTKCVFSIQHNTDLQNAPPSQSNIRIWSWVDGLVASSGPRCSIQRADYRRRFIRCLFYVIFFIHITVESTHSPGVLFEWFARFDCGVGEKNVMIKTDLCISILTTMLWVSFCNYIANKFSSCVPGKRAKTNPYSRHSNFKASHECPLTMAFHWHGCTKNICLIEFKWSFFSTNM